jgi:hypothetical protein
MMRYALNEKSDEAKVPLDQEVQHLKNFLEFNQLRFSNRLQVNFTTDGNIYYRRIMPLLLFTFVENAFKYGELHDAKNPVLIKLEVYSDRLVFLHKTRSETDPKKTPPALASIIFAVDYCWATPIATRLRSTTRSIFSPPN